VRQKIHKPFLQNSDFFDFTDYFDVISPIIIWLITPINL